MLSTNRAAQRRGWSHGGEPLSLTMWPGHARRPPFRQRTSPETATSVPTDSASVSRNCNWLHRAGDRALRRRSIKLLFAGLRLPCFRLGARPWSERRASAQPGHVVKDRGSPPWLHPRRYAAWGLPAVSAGHDGLDCGNHPMGCDLSRAPAPVKAFARQQRPAGPAFTGAPLSNTLDNRTRATCDLAGSFAGLAIMRQARRVARSPTETPPSRGQLRR